MNTALSTYNSLIETSRRAADFVRAAKELGAHHKAAVTVDTTGGAATSPLAAFSPAAAGFVASLSGWSAFDSMLPSMVSVPLRTVIATCTTGVLDASVIGEGLIKPVSTLALASAELVQRKAVGVVVLSDEVWRSAQPEAQRLIENELRFAVAVATDTFFVEHLTSGIAAMASASSDPTRDVAALLAALETSVRSKIFLILSPDTAKLFSFVSGTSGVFAFPDMTPSGGQIQGVRVLVSSAVADDQIIAIDASGVAASGGTAMLDRSSAASIQMNTDPESPATASTVKISFWQTNSTGIRCERWFGCERLRASAVAWIDNASYAADSP